MKTYTNRSRTTTLNDLVSTLNTIFYVADQHKNCYFWTNLGNASSRRSREFEDEYEFSFNGDTYSIYQSLQLSCKNAYFTQEIKVNGVKKDRRALTKLDKAVREILNNRN